MKMILQKTVELEIDTDIERKRIDVAFKNETDSTTREKLHELMDLIEKQDWNGAKLFIESKWWQGYDNNDECPRLEFIGWIHHQSPFFNNNLSYIDIIYSMINYPNNYKIIRK